MTAIGENICKYIALAGIIYLFIENIVHTSQGEKVSWKLLFLIPMGLYILLK